MKINIKQHLYINGYFPSEHFDIAGDWNSFICKINILINKMIK
jgi:hypothetical protein